MKNIIKNSLIILAMGVSSAHAFSSINNNQVSQIDVKSKAVASVNKEVETPNFKSSIITVYEATTSGEDLEVKTLNANDSYSHHTVKIKDNGETFLDGMKIAESNIDPSAAKLTETQLNNKLSNIVSNWGEMSNQFNVGLKNINLIVDDVEVNIENNFTRNKINCMKIYDTDKTDSLKISGGGVVVAINNQKISNVSSADISPGVSVEKEKKAMEMSI